MSAAPRVWGVGGGAAGAAQLAARPGSSYSHDGGIGMWLLIAGGVVFGALLARRIFRTGDDANLGSVSTEWLTTHRAGRRSIEP